MDKKYAEAFALKRASSAETFDLDRKMSLLQQTWDAIPEPKTDWGLASPTIAGMGYVEMERHNYAAAAEHFLRAIEVDVNRRFSDSPFRLATIYLDHLDEPEKAREYFQLAADISERAFRDEDPKYFLFFKGKENG
ncbi:hypothetical protein EU803_04350 [Loktanella sp. IMCC34160]|uniref:hypothetical protein n=1 Tax=Loktanella sp. IMCC34160 TaxID=2510646 RepID=UPI00101B700C|nr:hypothetical protein [Loktanella sp. IMCC34160]RYG93336.1 hypothetical protein EU803_04350 [Loktanella sp. IMCC34160]